MTDKIVIKGVPPQWDQAEYERRVEEWTNVYRGTERSMELVRASLEHDFLKAIIDKAQQGYIITPNKRVMHSPLDHSVFMVKPLAEQEADIAEIRKNVKTEYIEWLEKERTRYQELLRQQLIQAQEEKEAKAAEQAKAKQMAAIEKQVTECYAPLVIPE